MLQENVTPPSEVGNSIVILTQTLGEEFPYSTLGLWPRYGNSSPRVWVRITIILPPSEGGMYHSTDHLYYRGTSVQYPALIVFPLYSGMWYREA